MKLPIETTGLLKQLLGKKKKIINISNLIQKAKEELYPKRDHVLKQFSNLGIAARQLQNDELIKLYYSVYEPDKSGLEILNIRESDIGRGIINTNATIK